MDTTAGKTYTSIIKTSFNLYPLKIYSVLNSILEDNKNMDNVVFNPKKIQLKITWGRTTDPDNGFSYFKSKILQ